MLKKILFSISGLVLGFAIFCGVRAGLSMQESKTAEVVENTIYIKKAVNYEEIIFSSNGEVSLLNFNADGSNASWNAKVYYEYDGAFGDLFVTGYDLRFAGTLVTQYRNTSSNLLSDYGLNIALENMYQMHFTLRVSNTYSSPNYTYNLVPIFYWNTTSNNTFNEFTLTDMQSQPVTTIGTNANGVLVVTDNVDMEFVNYIIGYPNRNTATYQDGYDDGYADGNAEGYGIGFNDGINWADNQSAVATSIFIGIIDVALLPINFFLACLNFEVFGINIGSMVTALLTIMIVIIIVRVIFIGGNKK